MPKRENYLSWDDYFMGIALLSSKRSKDPSTQVGACIVNSNRHIVGVGYNGFPNGCSDNEFPWDKNGKALETKYPYVCHAELNAILNSSGRDLSGAVIYTTLFPCSECAKAIIQSGIKSVIYLTSKSTKSEIDQAARKMFLAAGIDFTQLTPQCTDILLSLEPKEAEPQ